MAAFFSSLNRTIIAGLVIVLVMIGIAGTYRSFGDVGYWSFFMRWLVIVVMLLAGARALLRGTGLWI